MLLHSSEDNFVSVWRNVEVANAEVRREVGQLPLGTRLQIDQPQIFMTDLSSGEHERPSSSQDDQMLRSSSGPGEHRLLPRAHARMAGSQVANIQPRG